MTQNQGHLMKVKVNSIDQKSIDKCCIQVTWCSFIPKIMIEPLAFSKEFCVNLKRKSWLQEHHYKYSVSSCPLFRLLHQNVNLMKVRFT